MKRLLKFIAVILVFAMNTATVSAYNFPQPDWGALLRDKQRMVGETDFELYAESESTDSVYYGARLEPGRGTYIGMITEESKPFQPLGDYLTYIAQGYETDIYYPANEMIRNDNVMATIALNFESMYNVDYSAIRRTLDNLNSYNKPMYIRIAAEMNVSALGDEPDLYKEVFRTAANMVHEYPNFAVVWSPNDLGALDRPFEYYYPGDEYVDWVGVSCYSIKYFQGNPNTEYKDSVYFMTGDYAWATNKVKPVIEFMQKNNINKPVMLSEGGVATSNSYGEELSSWAAPRLRNMLWYLPMKYPQIKLINYFNTIRPETELFYISNHQYAADIFNEAAANGAYIREAGAAPDFIFKKAYEAGQLNAKDNVIKLYTLAYVPDQPYVSVNYFIDDVWQHSSDQIPYIYYMDVSAVADGMHTLKIASSTGLSKEYKFAKSGSAILFGDNAMNYIAAPAVAAPASGDIKVNLNGQFISFDQPPVIQDGRTLVPLRAIFEAMSASVDWNDSTRTVFAARGNDTVSLTIGNNIMMKNNTTPITLDVPAQIINSRTLVPARAVAEAFGAQVSWDEASRTVIINI